MDRVLSSLQRKTDMQIGRILSRDFFLYLLDLEVKRARRYLNFFCILNLKLVPLPGHEDDTGLQNSLYILSRPLIEIVRECDILGSLENYQLAVILPSADPESSDRARLRIESTLEYYDLKKAGYSISIDQICFPRDGTEIADLISKIRGIGQSRINFQRTTFC